jgi:crossover junction endodeoxyribonuclease RuvC
LREAGVRVIGVDPGSRITGFGVLEITGSTYRVIDSGTIEPTDDDLADRVTRIHLAVETLLDLHQPAAMALEDVFYEKNVQSTIKLAYARAGVFIAARKRDLPVFDYTPVQIKKALVGKGQATKEQVAEMVRVLTGVGGLKRLDQSDAIAVAVCHAHHLGAFTR